MTSLKEYEQRQVYIIIIYFVIGVERSLGYTDDSHTEDETTDKYELQYTHNRYMIL